MPVEIIEALEPSVMSVPEVEIQVLRWRVGYTAWTQCLYGCCPKESQANAARDEAKVWSDDGYHVLIITVDEQA